METTTKALAHGFLCPLCLLTNPRAFSCGPARPGVPLFLGICEYDKLLPSQQLFPGLHVLAYLIKTNPRYFHNSQVQTYVLTLRGLSH